MKSRKKLIITVVGGSNSAHTIVPLLSKSGHCINLLTRNPTKWNNLIKMQYTSEQGEIKSVLEGDLKSASSDPKALIPQSDLVLLSLPVAKYREVLHKIAPHIDKNKKIYLGTIYGQAGFNWMVDEIKTKFGLTKVVTFAVGLIPWITRTFEYGKIGINYGPKMVNVVAVNPKEEFKELNEVFLNSLCYDYFKVGEFRLADNFISLTLSVDNQIIHLSRLFGLFLKHGGKWTSKSEVPLFYKDYDDLSAKLLEDLDDDYSKIRENLKKLFPEKDFNFMLSYLDLERLSYGSANKKIKESFTTSKTLGQIPTPTIQDQDGNWVFDKNHRFFTDDLYYGLVIAKWFGEQMEIDTPTIDKIINWAQDYIEDKFFHHNKLSISENDLNGFKFGVPTSYGYNKLIDLIS
jgi:opine dehydrogenase